MELLDATHVKPGNSGDHFRESPPSEEDSGQHFRDEIIVTEPPKPAPKLVLKTIAAPKPKIVLKTVPKTSALIPPKSSLPDLVPPPSPGLTHLPEPTPKHFAPAHTRTTSPEGLEPGPRKPAAEAPKPAIKAPAAKAPVVKAPVIKAPPAAKPPAPAPRARMDSRVKPENDVVVQSLAPRRPPTVAQSASAYLRNVAMVRRMQGGTEPLAIWPELIKERTQSRSVWPNTLTTTLNPEVTNCVRYLLDGENFHFQKPSVRLGSMPYTQRRLAFDWKMVTSPIPVGIVTGLAVVVGIVGPISSQAGASNQSPVHAPQHFDPSQSAALAAPTPSVQYTPLDPIAPVATTQAPAPTTTTTAAPAPPPTTAKPTPPPTTAKPKPATPSVPANTSNCSSSKAAAHACWDPLINQYGWNHAQAFNVMWCESTGNPNARNSHSTATGLFQILGGPTDPVANVRQAYTMYSARGWQPWVCKP